MSYNKIILLGNLTRDPQLSYTPNNTSIVEIGLATNRKWKSKDGVINEDVCFVNAKMFGKRAEALNKYLKKGDPIFLEGRLTFDSWQDNEGNNRGKHTVMIENFEFVGGRKSQTDQPEADEADEDIPF